MEEVDKRIDANDFQNFQAEFGDIQEEFAWLNEKLEGNVKLSYYLMMQHHLATMKTQIFNPNCVGAHFSVKFPESTTCKQWREKESHALLMLSFSALHILVLAELVGLSASLGNNVLKIAVLDRLADTIKKYDEHSRAIYPPYRDARKALIKQGNCDRRNRRKPEYKAVDFGSYPEKEIYACATGSNWWKQNQGANEQIKIHKDLKENSITQLFDEYHAFYQQNIHLVCNENKKLGVNLDEKESCSSQSAFVCAMDPGTPCKCNGKVYFGRKFQRMDKPGWGKVATFEEMKSTGVSEKNADGKVWCSNEAFGEDPAPGYTKHCYCEPSYSKPKPYTLAGVGGVCSTPVLEAGCQAIAAFHGWHYVPIPATNDRPQGCFHDSGIWGHVFFNPGNGGNSAVYQHCEQYCPA
jgi:hypothetical protein